MKCTSISLLLVAVTTIQTTQALKSYLSNIPNGSLFAQTLGHPDSDETQFTDFATAFLKAEKTWTPEFCKATFPGSTMTNGAAFGDPCCTWKKGDTPSQTVTAFTTTPTKATVCAAATPAATPAAAATTPAPAATTTKPAAATTAPAPAATTAKPAAATTAPATTTAAPAAATTTAPAAATTPAAATKPGYSPGKVLPGKGCAIKPKEKGKGKESKGKNMRGSSSGSGAPRKDSGGAKQTSY